MPESESRSKPKLSTLYWFGVSLLVFGATLATNLLVRQFREPPPLMHKGDKVFINGEFAGTVGQDEIVDDQQSQNYGFISASILIAAVGIVVMVLGYRRSRFHTPDHIDPAIVR